MTKIAVIIPAFNEERAIKHVLADLPNNINEVVVVNNGSTDQTAIRAQEGGATVLTENNKGYGYACLKGIDYLIKQENPPEIVVFIDGDYSDHPNELYDLVNPILKGKADFVLGARVKSKRMAGSMTPQQVFGNALATTLMRLFFNSRFTDLGPFRAIRFSTLQALEMQDKTYGWTVEMQLKILKKKIPYVEIPVSYKQRIGVSKVSGTIKGTIFAGIKILGWIFKYSIG